MGVSRAGGNDFEGLPQIIFEDAPHERETGERHWEGDFLCRISREGAEHLGDLNRISREGAEHLGDLSRISREGAEHLGDLDRISRGSGHHFFWDTPVSIVFLPHPSLSCVFWDKRSFPLSQNTLESWGNEKGIGSRSIKGEKIQQKRNLCKYTQGKIFQVHLLTG